MSEYYSSIGTDQKDLHSRLTTCGRALVNTEVKITDGSGHCVPRGTAGELWLRGYGTFLEYRNQSELTNSVKSNDGWLKTG